MRAPFTLAQNALSIGGCEQTRARRGFAWILITPELRDLAASLLVPSGCQTRQSSAIWQRSVPVGAAGRPMASKTASGGAFLLALNTPEFCGLAASLVVPSGCQTRESHAIWRLPCWYGRPTSGVEVGLRRRSHPIRRQPTRQPAPLLWAGRSGISAKRAIRRQPTQAPALQPVATGIRAKRN